MEQPSTSSTRIKKTQGLKKLPWVPQEAHAVPTIELVMKMAMEKNAEEELFWFRKYYERDAAYLALIDSFIQVYKYTLQERVGWGIENEKNKKICDTLQDRYWR